MVKINHNVVKPSHKISLNHTIEVRKNQFWHQIQVLNFPNSRVGAKMVGLYCVCLDDRESLDVLKTIKLAQSPSRQKGLGRPTKRERRKIDSIIEG